ncbi:hypothetical protein JW872_00055 [Candidatus Babeliales bacterium]|nr:hypothetical protein [Candidatus Babeliales bacterium]
MNKKLFVFIFAAAHIAFVVLLIHKQNLFINLSYKKQKYEREITQLEEHKKALTQELCLLKNHRAVEQHAQNVLGMQPISMKQIRKLESYDQLT